MRITFPKTPFKDSSMTKNKDHVILILIAGIATTLSAILFIGTGADFGTSIIAIPALAFVFFEMGLGVWLGIDEERKKFKPKKTKLKRISKGLKTTTIVLLFLITVFYTIIFAITVSTMQGILIGLPIGIGLWALTIFVGLKWGFD